MTGCEKCKRETESTFRVYLSPDGVSPYFPKSAPFERQQWCVSCVAEAWDDVRRALAEAREQAISVRRQDGVDGVACLICNAWANESYNLVHVPRCALR